MSTAATTTTRGDRTRQRLIDAVVGVLVDRGWGAVTTRAVATRAGVRPGLVHYHFESIDELRRLAVVETLSVHFEPFVALATEVPPAELVEAIVAASESELAPGTELSDLLYEVMPATARDPVLRLALADLLGRFRQALAESVRRHHPEPLVPPDVAAGLVAAVVDGLHLHLLADPGLAVRPSLEGLLVLLGPPRSPTPADDPSPGDRHV